MYTINDRLTTNSRRSKTKCTGDRPQCRSCMKRKVACSWAHTSGSFHVLTPPQDHGYLAEDSISISSQRDNNNPFEQINGDRLVPSSNDTSKEPGRLRRLYEIFLARHHDVEFCSFFHKPSVDLSKLYRSDSFLLHAVCSLAALYLQQEEVETELGHSTNFALSDHYARLAKNEASRLYDEPSSEYYTITSICVALTL